VIDSPSLSKKLREGFLGPGFKPGLFTKYPQRLVPALRDDLSAVGLSSRQVEIVKMLALGYSCKEAARSLQLTQPTINTHIRRIYKKLNVNSRAEAISICMGVSVRPNVEVSLTPVISGLSSRQMEVLEMLARGYSFRKIANLLNVTVETIKTHIRRTYKKLNVNSRAEAVTAYIRIWSKQSPETFLSDTISKRVVPEGRLAN
jgi:DNA-binding NarL/FixJ family response regulator